MRSRLDFNFSIWNFVSSSLIFVVYCCVGGICVRIARYFGALDGLCS